MNLYHLRYFVTLAHLEHYTRAAEELGITQPSLSHAIAVLEEELGIHLFEHEGRNVVLSKYGRQFLNHVESALATLDEGVAQMKKLSQGQGRIDLGFLRGLGAELVPELITAFQATGEGREVEFHLSTGATGELLGLLEKGACDLVLASCDATARHVSFYPVRPQPFRLVVPEEHPLSRLESVRLEDTLEYHHIRFDQSAAVRAEIDALYAALPRMPQIAYEVQEAQDIAGLVANGFGVAVLPEAYFLKSLRVKVLPLEQQEVQRYIYLAVSQRHTLSPAAEAFRRFVLKTAQR